MWGAVPAVVGPLLCFPFHRGRHCHVRGQGTWRSHPARTPHSACAAATLAWKQATRSPHAILTPTSLTGLTRPFSLSDPCQGRVTPSQSVPHQQAGAEPPCLCRASPVPLMAWGTRRRPISNRPRSWELQRSDTTSCSPRLLARPWWRRRGESSFSTHLTERGVTYRGATPVAHRPDFSRHFPCTVDPPVSHALDAGPPNTAC